LPTGLFGQSQSLTAAQSHLIETRLITITVIILHNIQGATKPNVDIANVLNNRLGNKQQQTVYATTVQQQAECYYVNSKSVVEKITPSK